MSTVYDEGKFKELLLYVATRMAADDAFGATKLNKVLFYADFLHYASHGRAITGATYQKLQFGPAPRRLLPVRDQLIAEGAATLKENRHLGALQQRLIPLREPKLDRFTVAEIEFVDDVIEALWGHGAGLISRGTHNHVGWQLARRNDVIPYEMAFLADDQSLTETEVERGRQLSDELASVS